MVDSLGKELGHSLRVSAYVRVQCGEGLSAGGKDFAAEVAEIVKGSS